MDEALYTRGMIEYPITFPGTYRDAHGTEAIEFFNDGKKLRCVVRGVTFIGDEFECMEPVEGADAASRAGLPLSTGGLWNCEWTFQLPVMVSGPAGDSRELLEARVVLGIPSPGEGPSAEPVVLRLRFGGQEYVSRGRSGGFFENELLELQYQLPQEVNLRACITCAFSDYNPGGNGSFGYMACFRDNKEAYLAVRSKGDMFHIWPTRTEYVQETYLCPQYQLRKPGTGYRG